MRFRNIEGLTIKRTVNHRILPNTPLDWHGKPRGNLAWTQKRCFWDRSCVEAVSRPIPTVCQILLNTYVYFEIFIYFYSSVPSIRAGGSFLITDAIPMKWVWEKKSFKIYTVVTHNKLFPCLHEKTIY